MQSTIGKGPDLAFDTPKLQKHRRMRALKDKIAKQGIAAGGVSVIVAVTLIFFYLLYEVVPLFGSASMEQEHQYAIPGNPAEETVVLAMEEQAEIGLRLTRPGNATFFRTDTGETVVSNSLPIPEGVAITSLNEGSLGSRTLVAGLSDGSVLLFKHDYKVTYPEGTQRVITPGMAYPGGESTIQLAPEGVSLTSVAGRDNDSYRVFIGAGDDGELYGKLFSKSENFLTGEVELSERQLTLPRTNSQIVDVELSPDTRRLMLVTQAGKIEMYNLTNRSKPVLMDTAQIVKGSERITDVRYLLGGFAILVATSEGRVEQWFPVRDDDNNETLERIRGFETEASGVAAMALEERRKGFVMASTDGEVAIFNTTAHRRALMEKVTDQGIVQIAIAPRANYLLVETSDGQLQYWAVDNEHSDVSFSALWEEVWYEGYQEPEYIWQSSAANTDFEPKYSLMPLAFGTLKAAFYAMLLAVPLAICGAIYTAHFMAPAIRRKVKPTIELMEALPTVILGFLAGLFFAPFMEDHLPGVFAVLIILPIAIVAFGFLWANLPKSIRLGVPDGWGPVLLIPVIILVGWFCFAISGQLEIWFFGGNMPLWLTNELGIDYSQRNSLVIGVAMGFAVIPTIFSITEDAVFSVPKHLTFGSLALGATPWQTMTRVILPTASPGIFSAVMIGLGRAVGETMIVLMATGNTPIMDINIFEGMRTLSANIAVEMPESEVGSTHYRILFMAGFVLFLFTFVVNTLAEFVRQRLRNKYSVV